MNIPVTVYTTPNCVQCNATKREMDKLGIRYQVVQLTPEKADEFKAQGFAQAPIVTTDEKIWSGFRVGKIRSLGQFIAGLKAHGEEQ